ncbi:hypothetical protein ACF0H5_017812 [Mactra antiquata]
MSDTDSKLRLITYMSPGIPVDVFECILSYLEQVTGKNGYLIYESRWTGPPSDRVDPFTANEADIGFMESSDYLRLSSRKDNQVELCEAGPVHTHQKNTGRAVYYSDIIINTRNKSKYKDLIDLRGHTFGFSSGKSLSASHVVLAHLKKLGFDASFFGSTYESGSHLASIDAVLDSRVDVAAVNSNVLSGFLRTRPQLKDDLCILTSLGPLPTYPIVLNTRLPESVRSTITQSLLDMSKDRQWCQKLQSYGITEFVPIDSSLYDMEKDIKASIGNLTMASTYY